MGPQSLILIPGLLCDATVWQHQVEQLKGRSASIIIPDLSKASTPAEMVEAVLAVAPNTFALAGHSMGGWVALEVMRIASGRVSRLCLANTSALPDSPRKAEMRNELINMAKKGDYETLIAWLLRSFVYREDYIESVKAMLERNKDSFINQENAMQQRESCESVLELIQIPTLIIHSNKDDVFNLSTSQFMHDHIPGAKLAQIENCGHMSPIEAAEEVSALMKAWIG